MASVRMRADIDKGHRGTPASGPTGAPPVRAQAQTDHSSWMMTSLLLWLCALPLVGLLVLPWLGARVALVVAIALFVASVSACYALCTWQVAGPKKGGGDG